MTIWVDADACPVVIREILYRAADRTGTSLILVANHALQTPPSRHVSCIQVSQGFDVADNEIVKRCEPGDLVVTSDIPLADEAIGQGCLALSPRGELFSRENIKARLNMRDFLETLRSSGIQSGGPSALTPGEKQAFANQLDRWLMREKRRT